MRHATVFLLVLCGLSSIAAGADQKSDEDGAVARIKELGGQCQRRSEQQACKTGLTGAIDSLLASKSAKTGDPVVEVNFIGNKKVKDDDLRLLQAFPHLTRLHLGQTRITGTGLKHAVGLKKLTVLGLIETKVDDAGLKEIGRVESLQELFLDLTPITDAGLPEIGKLRNLQQLLLADTSITDARLEELANLPRLQLLSLAGTKVTDVGLKKLGTSSSLMALDLINTKITGAGLRGLARLRKLASLDLSQTGIGDADLKELAAFKNLKVVVAAGSKVTKAGALEFKKAMPLTRVVLQQIGPHSDPDFDVSVAYPAYTDKHPTVLFDEAHRNQHTASGRYKVFADLMTNDGYRITANPDPFTTERLAKVDLLVIANAPAQEGPSTSAFTEAECGAVQKWVEGGGALLLITDHEPFGSGSAALSERFGVNMSCRVAGDVANQFGNALLFSRAKHQIGDHAIMRGRNDSERIDRVLTFTGQSLKGPADSAPLLKFSDTAIEQEDGKTVSVAGRAQGVALKYGRGRVVVMGEAGDLSAQVYGNPPQKMGMNVPDCDNRKMALNIVHWLSGLID